MNINALPFCTTNWAEIAPTEHKGERGVARWHTRQFGDLRVRMVEYSAGYKADHWCKKGHILLVLEGELRTELEDGRVVTLKPGQSYQVADGAEPHRSSTAMGARLTRALERALGQVLTDQPTAELYRAAPITDPTRLRTDA